MQIQENIGNESMPSVLNDPFNKTSVKSIWVNYSEYGGKWSANGSVEFKNGSTEGKQKFDGETFDEVVLKMKAFINELNK